MHRTKRSRSFFASKALGFCALAFLAHFALLPQLAAAQGGPRIVNGTETQEEYSTGAMLVGSGALFINCTGTMIGCETFLTAAHCVCNGNTGGTCGTPNPANYKVYLQNQGILDVASIDVHPDYAFAVQHDIAIFTLSTPVNGIRPTPIHTGATPALGTPGTIVGFGRTGPAGETGLKRTGNIESASCSVPEPAHVCWAFENPIGDIVVDSNTCNGDSGGPLFMDLGSGIVVAGVTSGGDTGDCLPTDNSFDASTTHSQTFIDSIAGADLLNTSCGSSNQVGDGGDTEDFKFSSLPPSKAASKCRKEIRKQHTKYATAVLKVQQQCLNGVGDGSVTGPCPDADATAKIAKAVSKVSAEKIAKKCTGGVVPFVGAALDCENATDADDLAACILAAGDSTVATWLDVSYADASPVASIADADDASCQATIGKVTAKYAKALLKNVTKCQKSADSGKVASCPDAKTAEKIAKALAKVEPGIAKSCDDANLTALNAADAFGGSCAGVTTVAAFAACTAAEHEDAAEGLTGLVSQLTGNLFEFTVSGFINDDMIITLNGLDDSGNDLDIYLQEGSAPTTSVFDESSTSAGVFEEIIVSSPPSGTYFILVDDVPGNNTPFQLTVTLLDD